MCHLHQETLRTVERHLAEADRCRSIFTSLGSSLFLLSLPISTFSKLLFTIRQPLQSSDHFLPSYHINKSFFIFETFQIINSSSLLYKWDILQQVNSRIAGKEGRWKPSFCEGTSFEPQKHNKWDKLLCIISFSPCSKSCCCQLEKMLLQRSKKSLLQVSM